MSTVVRFRLANRLNVQSSGQRYLFDLSTNMSVEQRQIFINAYRGHSESSAAYALSNAQLWSKGIVKPKPESVHRYVEAISRVLLDDQKRELLSIECQAYYEELTLSDGRFRSFEEVTYFVLAGISEPASVAPQFYGYACSFFTPQQIQKNVVAVVRAKMQIVLDSLRELVLLFDYKDVLGCVQSTKSELSVKHALSGIEVCWPRVQNRDREIESLIDILHSTPKRTVTIDSETSRSVVVTDVNLFHTKSSLVFGVEQLLQGAYKIHQGIGSNRIEIPIPNTSMSLHYHSYHIPLSELKTTKSTARFWFLTSTVYLIWLTPSAYWVLTFVASVAWIVSLRFWEWSSDTEAKAVSFIGRLHSAKETLPSNPSSNDSGYQGYH